MLTEDIIEINRRLCFNLWYLSDVNNNPQGLSPRLILPKRRNGEIRISEQEPRFLYCGILDSLNYFYSIETPTREVYQQSGQSPLSARSDISLYLFNGERYNKIANVELKAHNPSETQIQKDIEKLLKERLTGNWFHILKNIDSGTLPSLFEKFISSFKLHSNLCDRDVSIIFCFCVLEKRWACINHFSLNFSNYNLEDYANDFFNLDYIVKSGKIDVSVNNGWTII